MNVSESQISDIVKISCEKSSIPKVVYHYTAIENLKLIFLENVLSFKLTAIDKFEDKLEGKSGEVFWDIALEELASEGIITKKEQDLFRRIEIPIPGFIFQPKKSGRDFYKSCPPQIYVGCFCTERENPRMINEYIKNDNHEGICIGLFGKNLLDWEYYTDKEMKGYKVSVMPVLYGMKAVDDLKQWVTRLLSITQGTETECFKCFGLGLLKEKLSKIVYSTKVSKYEHEKEYRIILQIPESAPEGYEGYSFEKVKDGVLLNMPRSALESVKLLNLNQEQKKFSNDLLRQLHYGNWVMNMPIK